MRSFAIVGAVAVALSVLSGCAADAASPEEDAAQSEDAVVASSENLNVSLFKSPNGLAGCDKSEIVTRLDLTHGLLPTYPAKYFHTATWTASPIACPGIPVPPVIYQGPTVAVVRTDLGCGSVLWRGDLPAGGKLEIFDHRKARGGWGCGKPSVNPVIVRTNGELSYAMNTSANCESLGKLACVSRSDCQAKWAYLPIAHKDDDTGPIFAPPPVFAGCLTNPTTVPVPVPVTN